ncbi:MAG TPA: DNA translocase FtsK 4TM domain-containing protein [Candidatus Saccharimonadales bacterium]|nr:DNA translocase FtsK 4TM domain-containing protein [Candidatus Saccharimonadales bacterium]
MAKKKKQTRRKRAPVAEDSEKSAFWPLAGAILMFLLAAFVLLGGFGAGGELPRKLFHGAYWALGWGGFLAPVALVYFGILKFSSEDRQIPLAKLVSMLAFMAASASWLHVTFTQRMADGTYSGGHGGEVGRLFGNLVLNVLDKVPANIMFLVFSMLLFFLSFGISPRVILKLASLFKRPEQEDTDLADLKAKANETSFKMNEGVPVEHHSAREAARMSTFKNTAQKLSPDENHHALITASDPDWQFPSMDLLIQKQDKADAGDVEGNAEIIKETLANFNINVDMEGANIGPRVTQFTLKPPTGVKLAKITALENNLALDLAAHSIRIEAPIPGKRAVGIEVPNLKAATVRISSILQTREWNEAASPLTFVIGKDISGQPVLGDLARMPHLLVAGQTGSGKSVMINGVLTSLLFRNSPADLKLILVDPKQVELKPYDDIPHLLTPVITEPEKCISALKWTVAEMERRYRALSEVHRRNIVEYNNLKKEEGMPYIVIVIDELSDLMMMAARDVEALIVRIAQKARAVGIHLVLATQRPSVDVITGLIKANIPARVAFTTTSQVDSRTIIDQIGAEKLLNMGDMLLTTADNPKPRRVQAALIEDSEALKVNDFIRMQRPPQFDEEVVSQPVQLNGKGGIVADYGGQDVDDDMYRDAVRAVIDGKKASTSLLQRRLRIGYGRAARLIETMEEQGIISHADGNRPREVLVSSLDDVFNAGTNPDEELYDENFPDDTENE